MTENINLRREEENLWYRKELLWIVLANSSLIWFSVSWQKLRPWHRRRTSRRIFRSFISCLFISRHVIASFSEESFLSSLKAFIAFINNHIDFENYAIVIARVKCSKKNIKNKIILRCDCENKFFDFLNKKRRQLNTRLIQCSFFIVIKLIDLSE
jgi:hypothetical protein